MLDNCVRAVSKWIILSIKYVSMYGKVISFLRIRDKSLRRRNNGTIYYNRYIYLIKIIEMKKCHECEIIH